MAGGQSSPELGLAAASGARWLAAEAWEARGRRGDPSGGLTSGGEVARRASGVAQCARHSGRGGEERGVRMSVVELAGGVAPLL
jgi:hypothetical protein